MRKLLIPLVFAMCTALAPPAAVHADTGPEAPLFESADLAISGVGAHTYRIPALAVTPDGVLVAAYDRRNNNAGDLPNDIDVLVRTSRDDGRTWTDPVVVADYSGGVGVGDPSLIIDRETGRIFVFYAYGPPGIGYFASGQGNDPDSTKILHADYSYSDDGGKTWTARRITQQIKDPSWYGMFASSGTGIQLTTGRLIQQYAVRKDGQNYAGSAYSDDHGETWKMGELVGPLMDENKTVELADGRVMLNSRTTGAPTRLVAYSSDKGVTYGTPQPDDELIDPGVNASIIRYDLRAKAADPRAHWLLFSNPAHPTARQNLTVRMSCNDGLTWPISKVVDAGPAAYSTMVRLPDGTIGLFYEKGPYQRLTFVRFNLAWLGADCPTDPGHPKVSAQVASDDLLAAGEPGTVRVRVTNHGATATPISQVRLAAPEDWSARLAAPEGWSARLAAQEGWSVRPGRARVERLAPGQTGVAAFTVTPPAGLPTGTHPFTATVRTAATEQVSEGSLLVTGGQAILDETVDADFDGTSDNRDLTDRLRQVAGLREGTVAVRFRTDRRPVAGTLLSASDTSAPSTNVTLSLNSGVPHFESRQDGRYLALLNGTASLADGQDHVLAVSVTASGTTLYADGAPIASTTGVGLFGQLSGLDGMWVGRNVDDGGPQWLYAGHVDRVAVYGAP